MKPGRPRARPVVAGLVLAGLLAACSTATEPAASDGTLPLSETVVTSTSPPVPEPTTTSSSTAGAGAEVAEQIADETAGATGPGSETSAGDTETSAEGAEPEDAEPTGEGSEPATEDQAEPEVPLPEGELIEFAPSRHLITMTRTVAPGERYAFLIDAVAGNRYTVTLGPSPGVWLDSGIGREVAVPPEGHPRRATLVYPENVTWPLEVVSTAEQPVDFEITATVRPLAGGRRVRWST